MAQVNILALEAVYWTVSIAAEVARAAGTPLWGATVVAYSLAVFVAALGFVLCCYWRGGEGWGVE